MATQTQLTCPKCGPLTIEDVVDWTEYDQAAGAIQTVRHCAMCDGPVVRA